MALVLFDNIKKYLKDPLEGSVGPKDPSLRKTVVKPLLELEMMAGMKLFFTIHLRSISDCCRFFEKNSVVFKTVSSHQFKIYLI